MHSNAAAWSILANSSMLEYQDLDLIFQRNPFSIYMPAETDLMFFKEW